MESPNTQTMPLKTIAMPSSFCVIQKKDGTVDKLVDKTLEEYLSFVADSSVGWIDYTTKDLDKEIEKIAATMGFTQIPLQKLLSGFYSGYEDSDTELGIMLPAASLERFEIHVRPLIILMRGNFVMTVHNEDIVRLLRFSRYAGPFMKKIKEDTTTDKVTLILERIIDENNDRNFEYLREIEKHGDEISKMLIDEAVSRKELAHDIYGMKHVLISYLNVLWATKDVVDSLRYGDADLITDDEKLLGRIGILSDNIDRHIELSEQMSNVLASGLEVMQSIYNNRLQTINNRFALITAWLTILGTAFLVPNTLATIAGSGIKDLYLGTVPIMVGEMSDQWWYVPMLIISTVVATLASYFWVRTVWSKKQDE